MSTYVRTCCRSMPAGNHAVQSGKSWAVFHHFAGPQPRSTELVVLLQRIWNIAELQPHRLNPMPSDINQLSLQVCELLSRPPVKRLTIFINHLDQVWMTSSDLAYILNFKHISYNFGQLRLSHLCHTTFIIEWLEEVGKEMRRKPHGQASTWNTHAQ